MTNQISLEAALEIVSKAVNGTVEDFTLIDSHWDTPATDPNGVVYYRKPNGSEVCHDWAICKASKQVRFFHGTYGESAYMRYLEKRQRKGWKPA